MEIFSSTCTVVRDRLLNILYIITTCVCVCLCVRRWFRVLIDAVEPARTVGFRDREPARTIGFQNQEPVRTENGRPDRAGRGRGPGRFGQGAGVRAGSGRGFEKTGGQTGQGRGTHGGLHSGLRPRAPTSLI